MVHCEVGTDGMDLEPCVAMRIAFWGLQCAGTLDACERGHTEGKNKLLRKKERGFVLSN